MFYFDNTLWRSDLLERGKVHHAFSTRMGGVSTLPHLKAMNCGFLRGDSDENVKENIRILCRLAGCSENAVGTPQIHSTEIRKVSPENGGEGIDRDVPYPCDGFVTDMAGITLLVRVADCAPVLIVGERSGESPVIAAVHAGWRGAAGGIAPKAVGIMREMGAQRLYAAVGACIHPCCYQVGEDMRAEVERLQGHGFAEKHIKVRDGKLYADIAEMNKSLLSDVGVEKIDICPDCTACKPHLYHSHRVTGGKRGTMGAVISIEK